MTEVIKSPIIYSGSKSRFADVIKPLLPTEGVTNALDVFCGSGEVGVGMMDYDHVTCNDLTWQLITIHEMFQKRAKEGGDFEKYVKYLQSIEKAYGLGKFHKDKLVELKDAYEGLKTAYNVQHSASLLYMLHCCSFSNGMRWANGSFNLPYGRRNFNPSLQKKLINWLEILGEKDVEFTSEDFRKINFEDYGFIYCDPPYLTTTSFYQESKKTGWGIKEEYALYEKLDKYAEQGGKFMLSNQIFAKGKENYILKEWIESRTDLVVRYLDTGSYTNCNYQREDGKTVEVLVTNY